MSTRFPLQIAAAIATAASLAACERSQPTVAESSTATPTERRVDNAVDRTQERLAEAGEKTRQTLSETGDKLQPKLAAAGERISAATEKAAASVKEAIRPEVGAPVAAGNDNARNVTATVKTGPHTSVSGLPEGTRAAVNDAAITTAVKAGFLKDPGLSVLKIDVDTNDGVVVLNGVADDAGAKDRAAQIAGGVRGVREVRNHLSVKQG